MGHLLSTNQLPDKAFHVDSWSPMRYKSAPTGPALTLAAPLQKHALLSLIPMGLDIFAPDTQQTQLTAPALPILHSSFSAFVLPTVSTNLDMKRQDKAPSAGAVGAKTVRACDSCLRSRARWYCAADDAFLCQACDSSVHSANPLAQRHERIRLKTASSSLILTHDEGGDDEPTWHHSCKRKARSLRGSSRCLKTKVEEDEHGAARLDPMVPDIQETASIEELPPAEEEQLLYRVPIFDPVLSEFFSSPISEGEEKPPALSGAQQPVEGIAGFLLPPEIDLAEFEMDVESLLGQGLAKDAFCMEFLGSMESPEDSGGNGSFLAVKEEVDDSAGSSATTGQFHGETFNINFKSESEGEEKVVVVEDCQEIKNKRRIMLSLDYEAVISAWSKQGCPWTDGTRPQLNPDNCWPDQLYQGIIRGTKAKGGGDVQLTAYGGGGRGSGHAPISSEGREAMVSRYREKRRTRLFSKKIRYEVRKLNAEKRPRMKGRFVKRSSFANAAGATAAILQSQFAF